MPTKSLIVNRKWLIAIVSLTLISVCSIFNIRNSLAQTATPLEKAQTDYNFQFTEYRNLHEEYISARASYLSFKTATAKNDAFVKTKEYLTQVDKLYLSYIALVKEHGNSVDFAKSGQDKNKTVQILDSQISYINSHNQKISQTKTLEQLPPLATELDNYLEKDFQLGLNKILAVYEIAETETVLSEFLTLSRTLDRVVVFKLRAGETRSILANWSSEIKDIQTKTQENINLAREELGKTPENTASEGELGTISQITQKAKDELRRSKPLFEEVVRII